MAKKIQSLYLFTGVQNKSTRLTEIQKTLGKKLEIISFFGDELELEQLFSEYQTYTVFYPYKLIQIYQTEMLTSEFSSKFRKFFPGMVQNTILAFISSKSLKEIPREWVQWIREKGGEIVEERKVSIPQAISFLKQELKKRGIEASLEILELLVETRMDSLEPKSLQDLLELISQAKNYTKKNDTSTSSSSALSVLSFEDLEMLPPSGFSLGFASHSSSDPRTIFMWLDQLFSQKTAPPLEVEASSSILPLLFRQLKLMWQYRALHQKLGLSEEKVLRKMKIPSFLGRKIHSQSEYFSIEELEELLIGLAHLDFSLKSEDKIIFQIRFELYIIKIRTWIQKNAKINQKKGAYYVQN